MNKELRARRAFFRFMLAYGIVLFLFSSLFLLGCIQKSPSSGTTTEPSTSSPAANASSAYSIKVIMNNNQIASLTVSDLSKLAQVKTNVGGTDEQGPTLLSVLNLAGVNDFSEVTVLGFTKGRIATAEVTLKKLEVTNNVILALVGRGTAKLTGTDIGSEKTVVDVNKLVVK